MAAVSMEFLTSEPARMSRFLSESGMAPGDLAASLAEGGAGVLSAALDHICADESLLLVFASELRRKPEEIMLAQALLQGPAPKTRL